MKLHIVGGIHHSSQMYCLFVAAAELRTLQVYVQVSQSNWAMFHDERQ